MSKPKLTDDDIYFTTPESGTVVNISELVRISEAVSAQLKPGMSEAEIDQIITNTCNRTKPN